LAPPAQTILSLYRVVNEQQPVAGNAIPPSFAKAALQGIASGADSNVPKSWETKIKTILVFPRRPAINPRLAHQINFLQLPENNQFLVHMVESKRFSFWKLERHILTAPLLVSMPQQLERP